MNYRTHRNENPIYVFSEKDLRGLSPNFHTYVSVSDLYIPRIGPHICLQQNRQTDPWDIYSKSLTDNSFSGNICFKFSVLCLCCTVKFALMDRDFEFSIILPLSRGEKLGFKDCFYVGEQF